MQRLCCRWTEHQCTWYCQSVDTLSFFPAHVITAWDSHFDPEKGLCESAVLQGKCLSNLVFLLLYPIEAISNCIQVWFAGYCCPFPYCILMSVIHYIFIPWFIVALLHGELRWGVLQATLSRSCKDLNVAILQQTSMSARRNRKSFHAPLHCAIWLMLHHITLVWPQWWRKR